MRALAPLALLALLTLGACGAVGASTAGDAPTPSSVSVTPATAHVIPGATIQLTAWAAYPDGATSDVTTKCTWTSSSVRVANVDPKGKVAAGVPGKATINAECLRKTASAKFKVTAADEFVVQMALRPVTATVVPGSPLRVTAEATFADGSRREVTREAHWTTANAAAAKVDEYGVVTPVAPGTAAVAATLNDVTRTTDVRVVPTGTTTAITLETLYNAGDWGYSELGGMAYDRLHDALFFTKKDYPTIIKRYAFGSGAVSDVYTCYPICDSVPHVFNGELWIGSSSNGTNKLYHWNGLGNTTLNQIETITLPYENNTDLTMTDNRLYLVGEKYNGTWQNRYIYYLAGPAFTTPKTIVTPPMTRWSQGGGAYLAALSSGDDALLAVGGISDVNTSVEIWHPAGYPVNSVPSPWGSNVQVDSTGRLYLVGYGNIVRWAPDFTSRETFTVDPLGYVIMTFTLRETAGNVEVILAPYRARTPVLYRAVLPK